MLRYSSVSLHSIAISSILRSLAAISLKELSELIIRFNEWEDSLVSNPAIMGGETVFPSTRLTVRHVGTMLDRGELKEVIREDYPYLSEEDMEFAFLYVRAYSIIGRPKSSH